MPTSPMPSVPAPLDSHPLTAIQAPIVVEAPLSSSIATPISAPTTSLIPENASPVEDAVTQEAPLIPERFGIKETGLPFLETAHIWGLDFARVNMEQIIAYADDLIQARECQYFITANLNYVMLSQERKKLKTVNRDAAAIIADGYPIVVRSRMMSEPLPERVAGSDMILELAALSEKRGYRIFMLGAAPGVAAKAAEKLQELYPKLQIAGVSAPPFRDLSDEEHENLLAEIRATKPDILLVAFGQPKGELWIHRNFRALQVPLSIQLGASFDFLAGTAKRAPAIWQRIGCEWLYRTCCEPKRLGPRYAKNISFLVRQTFTDIVALLR